MTLNGFLKRRYKFLLNCHTKQIEFDNNAKEGAFRFHLFTRHAPIASLVLAAIILTVYRHQ